ncbi:MAG: hypothetical protein Q9195_001660 [Heterodermia aff. obscurata]
MICRMTLQPNGTLARAVNNFYLTRRSKAEKDEDLELTDYWYSLFGTLLSGSGCHFVFVMNALDECEKSTDCEDLLKFMKNIIQSYGNVSFICSSHSHVEVDKFFQNEGQNSSIVTIEDMNAKRTDKALSAYVNDEIERRKADAEDSAFYDPEYPNLLNEFRDTLLRNTREVFQWVQIWLNILLPMKETVRMAITSDINARELLVHLKEDSRESVTDDDLLTKGYHRLWDIICSREHDDFNQRARLFHLVLAAYTSSTTQILFTALRIRDDNFDRSQRPEAIMRLCSNFLIWNERKESLESIHSSAENFIRNLNMKQDKIAKGDEKKFFSDHRNHEMGIEINKWNHYGSSITRNLKDIRNERHASNGILAAYFTMHGVTHFAQAARKRRIDDSIWKDFIQCLVLPPDSAFGAFLLNNIDGWFIRRSLRTHRTRNRSGQSCLHMKSDRLRILSSHILACLPVFDEYDRVSSISARDTAGAHDWVELLGDIFTL